MPLRLDVKRLLSRRSDRVKCTDLHPQEPWVLVGLFSGIVNLWNYETQVLVKTFEIAQLPVRAARFIQRKNWVITGADDTIIRVHNYNTMEKVHSFEAHADYIRCIAVHPSQPYVLSSSDDMLIKLWNWEKQWECVQVFEGHTHYVMSVIFNPKDTNTFASGSLDRTIRVWQLGAQVPNFTLQGHQKGLNCLDYFQGGDKPYLVSGADDLTVKVWDYQNKACVQTLEGHTQNVTAVCFHPELPIILTGSEDGTVRIWHASTYRLESTLNYGFERVWTMAYRRGSNDIALGYDEGTTVIRLGRDEPAMSMDSGGKIIVAKHNELQQANLAKTDEEVKDGEPLALASKDMGACEIYPQTLAHSPNGRFVVVCGDGEYIIYTAVSLRNKSFGSGLEFVWSQDSSEYAVRESSSVIKLFKKFKERKVLKPDFSAEGIFGGTLIGVRGSNSLSFYDWETTTLVRRIDIEAKAVFWSETGDQLAVATADSFFLLKYNREAVAEAEAAGTIDEDGAEDAFEVVGEVQETIKTALWIGDCFIFTNAANRLNYHVGGEVVTIAHLDRNMYLLGYLANNSCIYLGDKELNVVSYKLNQAVLEYQTAVMRGDLEAADEILPKVPKEQRIRVAQFLEKQGFKEQALVVSTDPEHRFELALALQKLDIAREVAVELDSELKWKQLGEAAMRFCRFDLAEECMSHAKDYSGMLMLYTSGGKADKMAALSKDAAASGQNNIAFVALLLQGKVNECIQLLCDTDRLAEAALFARSYCPSRVPDVLKLWKESLAKTNAKAAQALADPTEYPNLFPELEEASKTEGIIRSFDCLKYPASEYPHVIEERAQPVEERGRFFSQSASSTTTTTATTIANTAAPEPMVEDEPVEAEAKPEAEAEAEAEPEAEAEEDAFEEAESGGAVDALATHTAALDLSKDLSSSSNSDSLANNNSSNSHVSVSQHTEASERTSESGSHITTTTKVIKTVITSSSSSSSMTASSAASITNNVTTAADKTANDSAGSDDFNLDDVEGTPGDDDDLDFDDDFEA